MATQHNFRIKNGLEVAGTERISSAGAITPQSLTVTADASVGGNLTITGNLVVNGTTTTLNTATLSVEDLNITVASGAGNSSAANGAGLTIAGAGAIFAWDHAQGSMTLNKELRLDNNKGLFFRNSSSNGTLGLKADTSDNITFRQNGQWDRLVIKDDGVDIAGHIYTPNNISSGFASTLKGYFYESTVDQNGTGKPSSVLGLAANINSRGEGPSIDFNAIWSAAASYQQDNWNEGWTVGRIAGVYDSAGLDTGALAFYTQTSGSSGGASSASLTEKMRLTYDGILGIGTSAPETGIGLSIHKGGAVGLKIKSEGGQGYTQGAIRIESSVNSDTPSGRGQGVYMFNEGTDTTFYAGTLYSNVNSYGIGFKYGTTFQAAAADDAEAGLSFVIKSDPTDPSVPGHIAMGHPNPEYPLDISRDAHGLYRQHRQSSSIGTGQEMYYSFNTADGTKENYSAIYTEIQSNTNGAESGKLGLRAAKAGNMTTGLLLEGSTSNIGIGENSPEYRLHVQGSNVSSGGGLATMAVVDNGTAYNGTNPGGGITFRGIYTSGGAKTNFATIQGVKENTSDSNYSTALRFTTRADGGNLTEQMRISSTGNITSTNTGEIIGNKWHGSHENIYWNSKLVSSSGYGNTPNKWFTQGGNVTITSEHPHNKGFSTTYTNVQSGSHTTNINNATPSTPHWKGVYVTFSGATNYGGNQNSSLLGGWESGEGAIMKCVYNGSGASNSTNSIRAYIWKNFFSASIVLLRQSFFYFLESGEFSSGYFAGYAGQYGSDYTHGSANTENPAGQHRHTTTGQWVYVNHAARSYTGATYGQSSQGYLNGFGFRPGYAATVWIAVPGLTTQIRNDGKTINIHDASEIIGDG